MPPDTTPPTLKVVECTYTNLGGSVPVICPVHIYGSFPHAVVKQTAELNQNKRWIVSTEKISLREGQRIEYDIYPDGYLWNPDVPEILDPVWITESETPTDDNEVSLVNLRTNSKTTANIHEVLWLFSHRNNTSGRLALICSAFLKLHGRRSSIRADAVVLDGSPSSGFLAKTKIFKDDYDENYTALEEDETICLFQVQARQLHHVTTQCREDLDANCCPEDRQSPATPPLDEDYSLLIQATERFDLTSQDLRRIPGSEFINVETTPEPPDAVPIIPYTQSPAIHGTPLLPSHVLDKAPPIVGPPVQLLEHEPPGLLGHDVFLGPIPRATSEMPQVRISYSGHNGSIDDGYGAICDDSAFDIEQRMDLGIPGP